MSRIHVADSNNDPVSLEIVDLNAKALPFSRDLNQRDDYFFEAGQGDIVTFQELFAPRVRRDFRRSYLNRFAPRCRTRFASSGLGTATKYEILDQKFFPFFASAGPDFFATKGVQWVQINHPELGIVDIFNTHLQASYTHPNQHQRARLKQVKRIAKFIEKHSNPNHTIILNGDFNFEPDSAEYKYLMETDFGFIDFFKMMNPSDGLHTVRRDNPYVCGDDLQDCAVQKDLRYDYMFVRPKPGFQIDLETSSADIAEEWNGVVLSDHDLLRAQIVLTPVISTSQNLNEN